MNDVTQRMEHSLFVLVDIFRGRLTPTECSSCAATLFVMKWAADTQPEFSTPFGWPSLLASNSDEHLKQGLRDRFRFLHKFMQGSVAGGDAELVLNADRLPAETWRKAIWSLDFVSFRNADPIAVAASFQRFRENESPEAPLTATPATVRELMVRLVNPRPGLRVYDPTCGRGSLLLDAARYASQQDGGLHPPELFGQELVGRFADDARVSLRVAGFNHDIRVGDTLLEPGHVVENGLMRFDCVLSHPPFGVQWGTQHLSRPDSFNRFGKVPLRKTSADLAFVLHACSALSRNGRAVVLNPLGSLFREGIEQRLRQQLIDDDVVEQVIRLPTNVFRGSAVQACALVLNRQKPETVRQKVIFQDLSDDVEGPTTHRRLTRLGIERVLGANPSSLSKGFSALVSREEIARCKFDLNPSRYVTPGSRASALFEDELKKLGTIIAARDAAEAEAMNFLRGISDGATDS